MYAPVTAQMQEKGLHTLTMVRETWGGDVLAAYDYLRARMGTGRPIGVIGASCGGAQAVQLLFRFSDRISIPKSSVFRL